jgi:hypothetical protein
VERNPKEVQNPHSFEAPVEEEEKEVEGEWEEEEEEEKDWEIGERNIKVEDCGTKSKRRLNPTKCVAPVEEEEKGGEELEEWEEREEEEEEKMWEIGERKVKIEKCGTNS